MTTPHESLPSAVPSPALRFESITAGYGPKDVLRDLDLTARPGEILLVAGSNGAGKSTLLRAAMGQARVSRGRIRLGEQDLTTASIRTRVRSGLSHLVQIGGVFPSLTSKENLALAARTLPPGLRGAAIEETLEALPEVAGRLERRAGVLSGGQRQALALGMVLTQRPRVLLLDEPSAGLSPAIAQGVLDIIRRLNETRRVTVVLVEQRVREALTLAHRAVWLEHGALRAETEEPGSWLESGVLESLAFSDGRASHVPHMRN